MVLKSKAAEEAEAAAKSSQTSSEETSTTTTTTAVATKKAAAPPSINLNGGSVFISNPAFVEAAQDADWGTFPSVVASNGTHKLTSAGNKVDLGKKIKFQAILQKDVWKITPGETGEEAKEYFKVSYDGVTTTDGMDLQDALAEALDAGYKKASIKEYIDVICVICVCDDEDYIGETVTLQLAPSSQFTWKPLAGKCKMRAAMGKLKAQPVLGNPELGSAVIFTSQATDSSWKGNDFTKFEFSIDKED